MRQLFCVILIVLFLSGCNYLDMVPENDIETVETIFEKRENADDWLKSCYSFLPDNFGSFRRNVAFTGADEFITGDYMRNSVFFNLQLQGVRIASGLQMSQDPYGNIWSEKYYSAIRYCNIFLDNIGKVYNMEEREKEQWTAEIKALKAYLYFELVRRYGPIVLVPQNIDVNEPVKVMQQPRRPVDECFKAIVTLLDEAIPDLIPYEKKDFLRRGYFSLEGAHALKARALLYAASPLFNGNDFYTGFVNKNGEQLFNATYDREKWKRAAEAADEAIRVCEQNGRSLYSGTLSKPTKLQNFMLDVENSVLSSNFENSELLFPIRVSNSLNLNEDRFYTYSLPVHQDYSEANSKVLGILAPGINMVEMFYTEHGLPIEADKEWNYSDRYQMGKETNTQYLNVVPLNEDVLNLHLRREPRFYANIAADRCSWERDNNNYVKVDAFRKGKMGTTLDIIDITMPQNLSGYWIKKHTYSNVGTKTYAEPGDNPFPAMRLAELYLIAAEAWNEYEGPGERVFAPLNKVRARAGIPDVEIAWKTYSRMPEKINTADGMREIIRQEINIEFAFEGHRFWNLRRWKTAHLAMNEKQYGWNILGENARSFYNNFEGPVIVSSNNKFVAPRDYLFPIRAEEVLVAGCKQNPGW